MREAAVVDREEPATGGRRLVAYVVPAGDDSSAAVAGARDPGAAGAGAGDPGGGTGFGGPPGAGASTLGWRLRRFLGERLPAVMVPAAFVMLPRLPWTANLKLDRAALPEPESQEDPGSAGLQPPRTPVEEVLAGLWTQLLGVEGIGVEQDFFDLGGHSLLAAQLVSRVREALAVELGLRDVFAAPTIAGLAERIAAARRQTAALPRHAGAAPLSFAQERLWFLAQLEPGSPAYHIPVAVRLRGRLQVPALAAGLSEVMRRHEALRARFVVAAHRVTQLAQAPRPFALPIVDLSAVPTAAAAAATACLAVAEAHAPFDLAAGLLLRGRLLRLGAAEHVLLLTAHHIAWDAWSTAILLRELAPLYAAAAAGLPSPLPELRWRYAEFAVWQRDAQSDERLADHLGYWRARLAGAPMLLELPADRPRPAVLSYRGGAHPVAIDAALSAAIARLARSAGATLFMTLAAAWNLLLHRLSGKDDLLVGFPIANRGSVAAEDLIGLFVNTLVLRSQLAGDPGFADLLAGTRQTVLEAYEHQDMPLEKLVLALAPERHLGRSPLFQAMLVLLNTPAAPLALPDLRLAPLTIDAGICRFDVALASRVPGRRARRPAASSAATCSTPRPPGGWPASSRPCSPRSRPGRGRGRLDADRGAAAAAAQPPPSGSSCSSGTTPRRAWRRGPLPAPADRGAGAADAGAAAVVADGGESLTYGALNAARQPAGAPPAAARRRPRGGGGGLRRALAGDGGRPARRPQGRRRLPAARSRRTRPSACGSCCADARRQVLLTRAGLGERLARLGRPRRPPASTTCRRATAGAGARGERPRRPQPGSVAAVGRSGQPGLRDLHLRLDRPAERRR